MIGRDDEVERVVSILARRSKNNPVLIGEPGVGKTAIVEGLAQRIAQGSVPQALRDKRVLALSLGPLVAGTKYRGEFEGRVKKILDEVKRAGRDIILFIDELHTLVGAGAAEGSLDLSSMIKPELARGELQCIGATTFDEYRKYVESDAALERRFQPVHVDEPTIEQTVAILRGLRPKYAAHHHVTIDDDALAATGLARLAPGEPTVAEDAPLAPLDLVAWRPAHEQLVLAQQGRLRTIVIRPGVVYGDGGDLPGMMAEAARTGNLRIVGDGSNRWPTVRHDALAELYARAVAHREVHGIFNATRGASVPYGEIAHAASRAAGGSGEIERIPLEAAREMMGTFADALAVDLQIDSGRATRELGWEPHRPTLLEELSNTAVI